MGIAHIINVSNKENPPVRMIIPQYTLNIKMIYPKIRITNRMKRFKFNLDSSNTPLINENNCKFLHYLILLVYKENNFQGRYYGEKTRVL